METSSPPRCELCGRPTFDPDKKDRPWARGVSRGRQVLICPSCQVERPDWAEMLDRCERCGSTRLGLVLGEIVCRQCGHARPNVGSARDVPGRLVEPGA